MWGKIKAAVTGHFRSFGRFDPRREIAEAFEKARVMPEIDYFYSGRETCPRAILGLHRSYTLDSRHWKPVALTAERLEQWVACMHGDDPHGKRPSGYAILTPERELAGIWFSGERGTVQFKPDRRVVVHALMTATATDQKP